MILTYDEIIPKYGKICPSCNRCALLLYAYEWSCLSCNYNLLKQKHELTKD